MRYMRMRRAKIVAALAVTGFLFIAIQHDAAESRRRWRDRSGADRITGERWGGYRRAMLSRADYTPVSFSQGERRSRVVARSRVVGEVTADRFQSPATRQPARTSGASVAPNYAATRNDNGILTERAVYAFRDGFSQRQSRQAMRSALGEPAETTPWGDTWKIRRIGIDGSPDGRYGTFEANYNGLGWDAKTTAPPVAKW